MSDSAVNHQASAGASKSLVMAEKTAQGRPFPKVTGGCFCRQTRYRMMSSPLFVYACHCQDCQKSSGSVFGCFASIERDMVASIGHLPAQITTTVRENSGAIRQLAACAQCKTILWASGSWSPANIEIRVGTLDIPGLMEPDIHCFIESKVDWVILPKDAKTCEGDFDRRKVWPKSSLKRLRISIEKYIKAQMDEEAKKRGEEGTDTVGVDEDGDGADKTPTAQSPEEKEDDDDEFDRKFKETEKALLERLEKLNLKLTEPQKVE